MSRILLVGNAVLDIVNEVAAFPQEDEEQRVLAQRIVAGGNAANTATVLARLGQRSELVCTLADDPPAVLIRAGLVQAGVELGQVEVLPGQQSPVSYITLSQCSGSRTIAHYRVLPELSVDTLMAIDWSVYDWIHFEGRNVDTLRVVLPQVREQCVDQGISLELEKVRPGLEALAEWADVLLMSRAYAENSGFGSAEALLRAYQQRFSQHLLSCTWGEQGSWLADNHGNLCHQPVPTGKDLPVVDTVGAGDVYNAGLIQALTDGATLTEAGSFAVALATQKVSQNGLTDFL